jgi:uncharacterized membrane protein YqjE
MSLAFDTHQIVQELKASGFSDSQAEAVTRVIQRTRAADMEALVTRAVLKAELAEQKADILKWTLGAIAFQTLAILGGAVALLRLAPG